MPSGNPLFSSFSSFEESSFFDARRKAVVGRFGLVLFSTAVFTDSLLVVSVSVPVLSGCLQFFMYYCSNKMVRSIYYITIYTVCLYTVCLQMVVTFLDEIPAYTQSQTLAIFFTVPKKRRQKFRLKIILKRE